MAGPVLWENHGAYSLLLTQAGCVSLHSCSSEPEGRIERSFPVGQACPTQLSPANSHKP